MILTWIIGGASLYAWTGFCLWLLIWDGTFLPEMLVGWLPALLNKRVRRWVQRAA